ncbi:MAG TPA: alpha/beta family hydrolase [Thermoanaerobaculia bacterium]|nr:alpha/beta family hydrolase [Thermoanaerobaculia bacterium]
MVTFLENEVSSSVQFLFAHGAGAPMDSPFMERVAGGVAEKGIAVARFEFPYMAARRQGQRKPPDRPAVLLDYWRQAVAERRDKRRIFIGGKSMGGRIATLVADELKADGAVCFGYPFHPPGKPETLRVAHLAAMTTPTLIVQGVRDALGNQQQVGSYELSPKIEIVWIQDGDHSLKPRKSSGRTEAENLAEAISAAAAFMLKR